MEKRAPMMVAALVAGLLFSLASGPCYGFEITIDVAPNVLNLQSEGQVVTVHTDIAYEEVNISSVYLNNVHINSWKEDDRGYFVAKFVMATIKELSLDVGNYNTLTMVGNTFDGDAFTGTQDILVLNNIPKGQ